MKTRTRSNALLGGRLLIIVALMLGLQPHAQATINFAAISTLDNFQSSGSGVVSPPPSFGVSLFNTTDGLKISSYDLNYKANVVDNFSTLEVSWKASRAFTAAPGDLMSHRNHLDGSVHYTSGFQLVDVTLRTISVSTDQDLNALHLGALPDGANFDQTLNTGTFSLVGGNDRLLSFFTMTFKQLAATPADNITLSLPSSAESSVSAVPLPPAIWLLGSALSGIGLIRRRIS